MSDNFNIDKKKPKRIKRKKITELSFLKKSEK